MRAIAGTLPKRVTPHVPSPFLLHAVTCLRQISWTNVIASVRAFEICARMFKIVCAVEILLFVDNSSSIARNRHRTTANVRAGSAIRLSAGSRACQCRAAISQVGDTLMKEPLGASKKHPSTAQRSPSSMPAQTPARYLLLLMMDRSGSSGTATIRVGQGGSTYECMAGIGPDVSRSETGTPDRAAASASQHREFYWRGCALSPGSRRP